MTTLLRPSAFVVLLLALSAGACSAPRAVEGPTRAPPSWWDDTEAEEIEEVESKGFGHRLLFYIPNRIFDVFDIVRARVRLGPGFAVGVRATELADVYVGSYVSVFAGVHGPRGEPRIPWPVGVETHTGVEVSFVEGDVDTALNPTYGAVEFGVTLQALIVGVDVGIDPLEILDLVTGLVTIDLTGDDY